MARDPRDPAYLDDPLLLGYVQALWAPLVRPARGRGTSAPTLTSAFAFEAFLVRDRSVNAFALPGGYVGVHLGLIAMTGTPDELASVLAHELSHVTQRHIARGVAARAGSQPPWAWRPCCWACWRPPGPAAPTWRRPPSSAARPR
jgi:predicted Zn-dependent protease